MGNFEKLGILVIIILVVVILVLAIWGVGVPPEELFPGDDMTDLSSRVTNGHRSSASGGGEVVLPNEPPPAPPAEEPEEGIWPDPPPSPPAEDLEGEEPATGPSPEAPRAIEHVVKKGETLTGISRTYYGDGKHWKRILAANPGVSPRSMKLGTTLRIPRLDVGAPAPGPSVSPSGPTYLVKKGDSLWEIARKLKTTVTALHEANRDVIGEDPASIRPEMVLVVPR